MKYFFYILLLFIAFFGLILRLDNYHQIPPFDETKDEFIYPWAGMSLLQTGIPSSWSPFSSYPNKQHVQYWGESFTLVSPYIEKPFLYSVLVGGLSLVTGAHEFNEVRLSTIRLLPIMLNVGIIILIGLFIKQLYNEKVALLCSLLYTTIPTIVLANRLSVTESLLMFFSLSALYLISVHKNKLWIIHSLGIIGALSVLTKQVGFVIPFTSICLLASQKNWKQVGIISIYAILAGIIHPLIAWNYGWNIYVGVTEELRQAHALGLPEAIYTLFRFPGIGHKESLFLDGSMLLGFILIFASPFWTTLDSLQKRLLLLVYPFLYLVSLTLGEGGTTWYGWHVFPLYPFAAIFLGILMYEIWHSSDFLKLGMFLIVVGISHIRFLLLIIPQLSNNWQLIASLCFGLITLSWFISNQKQKKYLLLILLVLYTTVNLLTVFNFHLIYSLRPQPI